MVEQSYILMFVDEIISWIDWCIHKIAPDNSAIGGAILLLIVLIVIFRKKIIGVIKRIKFRGVETYEGDW